ncbi:hypothetical protein A2738_01520 [Candidatus Nomurabacteria bacterium RIFCSPHIGHO2_01_FULL_42_15]|uniref:Uncharacterized protein n=1 Tax=Candidatus Nomurabacteria bacterium RIFCSPHIGHO2_01_FULL_42_15 TaxID=1801742 RepID=A0A1F6VFZ4_9BACT|nr:MAG: hypothetical protein A2738_01520 [Candidatus Nomurabacteria bacterium RIFCSPHIGHO2_01_FULL_42_15]OGI93035.1 MAG: hypothetical protein A3A99_00650 [Candidatus Nomurabacteria bacterium RIFCSPLOWO2_01_FULL_41_18]
MISTRNPFTDERLQAQLSNMFDELDKTHLRPWKAQLLPVEPFGEGVWGLVDALDQPILECLDEAGARLYEKYASEQILA